MPFIQLTFNSVNQAVQEIIIAALSEINFDSFQQNQNELLAFIDKVFFNEEAIKDQLKLFGRTEAANNFSVSMLEEINWNKKWEENYPPVIIANQILIKAPFHIIKKKYDYEIELAPKMAFGTGHHETTAMVLEQMLAINFNNTTVLDYGCGTGILAIFAAIKNATTINAIDIDDWAYNNTVDNIATTGYKHIKVQQGEIGLVKHNSYNIILANINKNVILQNLSKLAEMLLPNGHLLLSGILVNDLEEVKKAALALFTKKPIVKTKGKWAMLAYKKIH